MFLHVFHPLQLKVYASTGGLEPERIEENDLGFATGSGLRVDNTIEVTFAQYFTTLLMLPSFLLGVCVLLGSSVVFSSTYELFSAGRKQFGSYFMSLSIMAFFLNVAILVIEVIQVPETCQTSFTSGTGANREETTGCDQAVIGKMVYQSLAVVATLLASVLIVKSLEKRQTNIKLSGWLVKTWYVVGCWMIILMLTLLSWAVIPSILLLFVYPSIVLSLTALALAVAFWLTVILSIPVLIVQNFLKNRDCWATYQYLIRLGMLSVALLFAGLLTTSYISATVFGSGVQGIVGLVIAIVPSILLTLFSENYRDWFLTRDADGAGADDGNAGSLTVTEDTLKFLQRAKALVQPREAASAAPTVQVIIIFIS